MPRWLPLIQLLQDAVGSGLCLPLFPHPLLLFALALSLPVLPAFFLFLGIAKSLRLRAIILAIPSAWNAVPLVLCRSLSLHPGLCSSAPSSGRLFPTTLPKRDPFPHHSLTSPYATPDVSQQHSPYLHTYSWQVDCLLPRPPLERKPHGAGTLQHSLLHPHPQAQGPGA